MSICSCTRQDHGGYTNSSWLESDLKVRKCDAMLFFENLYEPKADVILTIGFKIAMKCVYIVFLLSIARFFPCQ